MEYTDSRPADLEAFGRTLEQLADLMVSLTQTENAKAEAASSGSHGRINGFLQQEQALILRLRGLEQHRISLQKDLGWDTLTLQQILDRSSEEERELLSPVFARLDHYLRRLQQAREAAEKILKVRLHELEVFSQMGASYDNSGNVNPPGKPQGGGRIRSTYV